MKEYCVLVVLYRTSVNNCTSIQSLFRSANCLLNSTIVVWDNSPEHLGHDELKLLKENLSDVSYLHTPENISLSKIYNSVIKQFSDYQFHVFLDQDSSFDGQFFMEVNEARKKHGDINLFVPMIRHEQKLLSPGYYYSFTGSYRKSINAGINSTKNLSIITSGMCISSRYLRDVFSGFNEKLTFYGIDTYFSVQYRKENNWFYVLNSRFDHSLSLNENEPYEIKWARFKNHRAAMLVLTENTGFIVRTMCQLYLGFSTLRFKLKNAFLKIFN
jgi:hypothetical protein